jgi:hypothetical protein
MKKFSLLILFGCVFLVLPKIGFTKTYCFTGEAGATVYFELKSGKVDKKPFAGHVAIPGSGCIAGLWAAIITDNAGIQWITTNNSHDPVSGCSSVQTYGSGNAEFGFNINYDNGQDGTIDGSFFISPINCNAVPIVSKNGSAKPTDYTFGGLSKKAD